jgi:molybdate transport system substrate-binding protein
VAVAAAGAALGAITGCGGDDQADAGVAEELTVSAAASLTGGFEAYADRTRADERFSFAGSDELAAQIRQGAAPDVFAAANTELPEALYDEGLVEKPTVFATNTLVLAVAAGAPEVHSIEDLTRPGVDLILGTESVPFGSYAHEVLDRLPETEREAILANVRSEESDVKAAVGKLTQGAADASFVYASDVAAAGGEVEAIELPSALQPDVSYAVAVVEGSDNPEGAMEFVEGLLSGEGAMALEHAGFGPPPAAGR